ncbi:MAG: SMC-Scp complex subunit ScpB [Aureliella sp.]
MPSEKPDDSLPEEEPSLEELLDNESSDSDDQEPEAAEDEIELEPDGEVDEDDEAPEDDEEEDEPQDLDAQLRAASGSDEDDDQEDGEELSLEQLSASYASVLQVTPQAAEEAPEDDVAEEEGELDNDSCPTTPTAIIEALLFVGRSDSGEIAGKEIASLMRGVDENEVDRCVDELNAIYEQNDHAIRIARVGAGYKAVLADDLSYVRDRFYGRVRDIKLNQAAIDCLALVAYQPGVGRKQLDEQRGQPSGGVLNQLVRRELLEVRREGKGKTAETHYYPTEKMLNLAGLASLEDLPQVEDLD